jgi:hypothetical protein
VSGKIPATFGKITESGKYLRSVMLKPPQSQHLLERIDQCRCHTHMGRSGSTIATYTWGTLDW